MILTTSCWRPVRLISQGFSSINVAVAYIDTISAKESMTKNMPVQTTTSIQMPPAGPPLKREMPIPLRGNLYQPLFQTCWRLVLHQGILPCVAKDYSKSKDGQELELSLTML